MGWTWQVLWRRSGAQRGLLLPVLAVAVVGAALLGTFQLLLVTSENRAVDVALEREPAQTREVDSRIALVDPTLGRQAIKHAAAAFDQTIGSVHADRSTWYASAMYTVDGTQDPIAPYVYAASYPPLGDNSRIVQGAFPTTAEDSHGRIQVAVPAAAAEAYGWHVGSVLHVAQASTNRDRLFVVTGTFELQGPKQIWTRDVLGGATHTAAYPVIGSGGRLMTQAWGPLVVAPAAFTAGQVTLSEAHFVAQPDVGSLTPAELSAFRARLGDASGVLAAATKDDLLGGFVRSDLPAAIDSAVGDLQVTRVGLVIVELMLVAVAVTVLLLAARLLAERRAAEQTLMASRGASGRQIFGLAALESVAVAAVTTLVAPWLASWAYRAITSSRTMTAAGLHDDPGLPLSLWLACGLAALVLAGVLLGPVLRRRGSVVDAEQQLVRQDSRGGVARTGADIALVVLAAVALHQLQQYRSPVLTGVGGFGSVDPVLVLAPALVLLAGAVIALRVMPLLARVGERVAARSRALVGSLAAWEVGRRPGPAAGAVLLLTLVVGVGSFAQTFLATWRASQQDQADLAVGTDLRVVSELETPLASGEALRDLDHVRLTSPVVDRTVTVGSSVDTQVASTTLLGIDTTHADDLLRGRIGGGGWGARTAALHPAAHLQGAAVPGAPTALALDLRADVEPKLAGVLYSSLVVQDSLGARTTFDLPAVPADGGQRDVIVRLPVAVEGLQIVGLRTYIAPAAEDTDVLGSTVGTVALNVSLGNVRAITADPQDLEGHDGSSLADVDPADITPVPLTDVRWTALGHETDAGTPSLVSLTTRDGVIRVNDQIEPFQVAAGGQGFAAVAATDTPSGFHGVPALATPGVLSDLGAAVDDELTVDLGGAPVRLSIVGTVPYLPGDPHSNGLLVDSTVLARQALIGSSVDPLVDEWWLQVPDADVARAAAAVSDHHLGRATSRYETRVEATDGPLRTGIQAALWIVTLAALALAVAGFAMSTTVAVRTRRLELARLQAVGVPRGGLVRSVLLEYAMLGVLGLVAGLALGTFLGARIAPLVTVSSSGEPPVPGVVIHWSWPAQATLLGLLVVLVAVVIAVTTNAALRRASGELLRLGDER